MFNNKDPRDLVVLYTRATLLTRDIKLADLISTLSQYMVFSMLRYGFSVMNKFRYLL